MSYSGTTLLFNNNAGSTLAGPITNTATTLNVQSGGGALFPSPSAGQGFVITAIDAATGLLREIMLCTARSTDAFTVVRGQEGTTALNWLAGDFIQELWTAGQAASLQSSGPGSGNIWDIGTFGGTANALTATLTPAPTSLTANDVIHGIIGTTNTSATVNVTCNSLAAVPIKGPAVSPLQIGALTQNAEVWLVFDGTNFQVTGGSSVSNTASVPNNITVYNTSGTYTFTPPAGVTRVYVKAWGAGGGGGGLTYGSGASGGGGGGGGEYTEGPVNVTPGSGVTVTIGAGGTGGVGSTNSAGANGGLTSFGALASVSGGSGGAGGPAGAAGNGGTGGATLLNVAYDGLSGGVTYPVGGSVNAQGLGGSSYGFAGGNTIVGRAPGSPAPYPGGGGNGGSVTTGGDIENGGAGHDGQMIISY